MGEGSSSIQTTPQPLQSAGLHEGDTAVVVNAQWLNERATPESEDNVIPMAHGGWIKVRQANGTEGWVGSSCLASNVDLATLPEGVSGER